MTTMSKNVCNSINIYHLYTATCGIQADHREHAPRLSFTKNMITILLVRSVF